MKQPNNLVLQMASKTAEAGTLTEPESLGPCEPGTNINLDGIVWNETKGGESEWVTHRSQSGFYPVL